MKPIKSNIFRNGYGDEYYKILSSVIPNLKKKTLNRTEQKYSRITFRTYVVSNVKQTRLTVLILLNTITQRGR